MDKPDYDFRQASAVAEPYDELNRMRSECPIVHTNEWGGHWIVLNYEGVHKVCVDPATFSSVPGVSFPPFPYPPTPPIEVDPPLHQDFRMPLLDHFSHRAVLRHERFYRHVIGGLLDRVADVGEIEAVSQLLQPMTGNIASQLLGFPEEDMEKLSFWASRILANAEDIHEVMGQVFAYFGDIYDSRQAQRRDDIPSLLIHDMPIGGKPMDKETFGLTMTVLFTGGLDTTVGAGAHMLERLATHDEERRALQQDPSLIPRAVEEYLRYFSPLMSLRRRATRDVELEGHRISEGESVLLHWLAANHDPAEFDCPEEVRLDRNPNRHYAFGAGIHRCLGSNVARQELRILLEEVLRRVGDWALDPERPTKRYPAVVRGISELWLTFTPKTAPAPVPTP